MIALDQPNERIVSRPSTWQIESQLGMPIRDRYLQIPRSSRRHLPEILALKSGVALTSGDKLSGRYKLGPYRLVEILRATFGR